MISKGWGGGDNMISYVKYRPLVKGQGGSGPPAICERPAERHGPRGVQLPAGQDQAALLLQRGAGRSEPQEALLSAHISGTLIGSGSQKKLVNSVKSFFSPKTYPR